MADITLTIPDAVLPRVREAMCAYIGLSGADITNANAKAGLVQAVKNITRAYERQVAEAAITTPDPPDVT
jgi:hypothetical protein